MPLLRYFIVVGSALIGLLYVVNAVLPDNAPRHVSSNIDGITSNNLERNPPARQLQHPAPVIAPAPEPDMTSSAAVPAVAPPAGAEESPQKSNTPSAPVAEGPPPNRSATSSPVSVSGGTIFGATEVGATEVGAAEVRAIHIGATGAGVDRG
jgi:hypothetical protein